jgi:hypothetical protein
MLLSEGTVTPQQLAAAFNDRLQRYDGILNAAVTVTSALADSQAAAAQAQFASQHNSNSSSAVRSLLAGVPYGLKDLFAVPGYPTTWGLTALRNRTIDTVRAVAPIEQFLSLCAASNERINIVSCDQVTGHDDLVANCSIRTAWRQHDAAQTRMCVCCVPACSRPGRTVPCLVLLVVCCWPRQPLGSWPGVTHGLTTLQRATRGMWTQAAAAAVRDQRQQWQQVG